MQNNKVINIYTQISKEISASIGQSFVVKDTRNISGGSINQTCELVGDSGSFFVKLNKSSLLSMFEAEFAGLQEMAETDTIKVPEPVVCGLADGQAFIVLEMLKLGGNQQASAARMGLQLAQMHLQKQTCFGWQRDNTIGSTAQINTRSDNWVDFWVEHRLLFQLQLAAENGYRGHLQSYGERLCEELGCFFDNYSPKPALLHGDLWSGNAAFEQHGQPVIFDPACYYGDHEADIAMTELFGGFSADFYAAYGEIYQLDAGYKTRKDLYNLYHILNHLNLFGSGYLSQAENIMQRLLAEL